MKKIVARDLQGKEFEIELAYEAWSMPHKKHLPEIIIASFQSFGLGTRLRFEDIPEEDGAEIEYEEICISKGDAVVTKIHEIDNKIIIEAEKPINKEDKEKILNKIIKKIDFNDALNDKIFIEMLSNVFTEEQLTKFLEQDDIEILLFNGLMYLKSGDKVYRL